MGMIDWDRLNDQFVRLEPGTPLKLRLTNWTGGEFFGRYGIDFEVIEVDGVKVVERHFTVTSRRLIRELKPFLVKADSERRSAVSVMITRLGDGLNTRYKVEEVGKR